MIRTLALFLFAAAVLVAAPVAAPAAENDPGFLVYEKLAKDVLKTAADKVWGAADDAKRQGFLQFAQEQAERALEFDPDQADARKYLQYERKDGKWVQNAEEFAKMGHQNVHNAAESQEGFDKRMKKWEEEALAGANKYVATKYAELGELCAGKGYPEQANKGYEAALRLNKDNEKARKGLGYTKFGKVWLTKKQDDARKAASKAEVVKDAEKDQFEELFGTPLNKIQSLHFRFESQYDVAELQQYAQSSEMAYAYYLSDFGKDPGEDVFEGARMTFIVCKTEDQWNKVIDRYGSDKEWERKMGGHAVGGLAEAVRSGPGSTVDGRRDLIVHTGIHHMNHRIWRLGSGEGEKAWLDEGLAYYYSIKVMETCSTHCLAKTKGDYANGHKDAGGDKVWDKPEGWKPVIKQLVQKKDDTPLRSVMKLPLTKLDFLDTLKGWSVASWLMDLDRDKFTSVLDQMLDRAVKQENVFQGAYGKGLEDLEEDWHKYVLKCY